MISFALVLVGIILMTYAIFFCFKSILIIADKDVRASWLILFCLICFFEISYIGFLCYLVVGADNFVNLFISAILCFGALFVVLVLSVNYRVIKNLDDYARKMKKLNEALENKTSGLEESQAKLKKAKVALESSIEDFYTFRLAMEKKGKFEKIQRENQDIKKKLKKLKKEI